MRNFDFDADNVADDDILSKDADNSTAYRSRAYSNTQAQSTLSRYELSTTRSFSQDDVDRRATKFEDYEDRNADSRFEDSEERSRDLRFENREERMSEIRRSTNKATVQYEKKTRKTKRRKLAT